MLSQGIWFHLFPLKEILSKIAFKSLHDNKGENLEFYFDSVSPSVMSDSATPWTVAHWAPLSMGFSRQEYWSS